MLLALYSVSHTCRTLRAFAKPLFWTVERWRWVVIRTVKGLGRLRDALRFMPHLAEKVRHFTFSWDMHGEYRWKLEPGRQVGTCEKLGTEYVTLLEMTFIDRGALWDRAQEASGAELVGSAHASHFEDARQQYLQPGRPPPSREDDWKPCINIERSGPDGMGEGPRVNSAEDFTDCLTEIVAQLSKLREFRWQTHVTPIPLGASEALNKARSLKALMTNFWFPKAFKHGECQQWW